LTAKHSWRFKTSNETQRTPNISDIKITSTKQTEQITFRENLLLSSMSNVPARHLSKIINRNM
jgi:hypothetical protein